MHTRSRSVLADQSDRRATLFIGRTLRVAVYFKSILPFIMERL